VNRTHISGLQNIVLLRHLLRHVLGEHLTSLLPDIVGLPQATAGDTSLGVRAEAPPGLSGCPERIEARVLVPLGMPEVRALQRVLVAAKVTH